jgi:hypothetical protein
VLFDRSSRVFSRDYFAARSRFRAAAERSGFELVPSPIQAHGPGGEALFVDFARRGPSAPRTAVVVSSGTHGVEGFFGSALQLLLLDRVLSRRALPAHTALLFVHAINPYGFAWRRRVNEQNIDLNRNFLLRGKSFAGAPAAYRELDSLLNPPTPPTLLEPFWLKAGLEMKRLGFAALKNAIAQGQYDFPGGLFFGGKAPSESQSVLARRLPELLGNPERVIHIDLHTGLGPWTSYKLGVDMQDSDPRVTQLKEEFGAHRVAGYDPGGVFYEIQGGLGPWLEQLMPSTRYDTLLAEFGTYPSPLVLAAMRAENRAHHYAQSDRVTMRVVKRQLLEVFCPLSPAWRRKVAEKGLRIFERALVAAG